MLAVEPTCQTGTRREYDMGFWAQYVVPRMIDLAMKNEEVTRLRAASIPQAQGEVLEIGIGSGLNLPFYANHVQHIYGVDPSVELQYMARKRAAGRNDIELIAQSAEEMLPLAEASIDTAVVTWALCSIPNPSNALSQVKRVLRTSGRLIFIEHGFAPDPGVLAWQDRLTPLWKRFTGGCHLNRKVDELIRNAGFELTELRTFYIRGPRPLAYIYQGFARPVKSAG